jgi:hypothetical protein
MGRIWIILAAKLGLVGCATSVVQASERARSFQPRKTTYAENAAVGPTTVTTTRSGGYRIATPAAANWVESASSDRLTGKKEIQFTSRASGGIRQFGRDVTAALILRCVNPYQDKQGHRDGDGYSAVIKFSERVGVAKAVFRYRFDANPVHSITATLSDRGDILFASWPRSVDTTFIEELRHSAKLRAEINLPWAGVVLVEFATSAADKAMNLIPCGENQPAHRN